MWLGSVSCKLVYSLKRLHHFYWEVARRINLFLHDVEDHMRIVDVMAQKHNSKSIYLCLTDYKYSATWTSKNL